MASRDSARGALSHELAFGWREGTGPLRLGWGARSAVAGSFSVKFRFFQQSARTYPQELWISFPSRGSLRGEQEYSGGWDAAPAAARSLPPPADVFSRGEWQSYCAAIDAALNEDKLQKLVPARLVFHALSPAEVSSLRASLLDRLFAVPAEGSYRFVLHQGDSTFFGATPELLFRRSEGRIFVPAIAGTRALAEGGPDAAAAEAELLADPKERAEHAFVVDGIRAALRELGLNPGAPSAPRALRSRNLVHLFTPVEAADTGLPAEALLAALHPTPAVGGTPRAESLRFIERAEPWRRGLFASPLLFCSEAGETCLVAIRSGLLRPEGLYLFSGAGYVKGSREEREWEETARKMDSLRGLVEGGR